MQQVKSSSNWKNQFQQQTILTKQQFVNYLQIYSNNQGYYLYPTKVFEMAYDQLQKNNENVIKAHAEELIQGLHEAYTQKLQVELQYYLTKIDQWKQHGMQNVKAEYFIQVVKNYQEKQSLFSDVFIEKSKSCQYISLQRLNIFLNDLRRQYEKQGMIKLNYCHIQQSQINKIQNNVNLIEQLVEISLKYVTDPQEINQIYKISQKYQKNQQKLNQKMEKQSQELKYKDQIYLQLKNQFSKMNNKYLQIQQQLQKYENQTEQKQNKNKKLKQKLQKNSLYCNELEMQVVQLQKQLTKLSIQLKQNQQELQLYLNNYKTLNTEHEQLLEREQTRRKDQQIQQQHKIFQTRTLKQQLEDSNNKNMRLIEEKRLLIIKLNDHELMYMTKTQQLNKEIKQLQNLNKIDTTINGYNFSHISHNNYQNNLRIKNSSLNNRKSFINEQLMSSIISTASMFTKKNKGPKICKIQKQAAQIFWDSENQSTEIFIKQNNQYDYCGLKNYGGLKNYFQKQLRNVSENSYQNNNNNIQQTKQLEIKNGEIFSCKGYLIHIDGRKFEIGLAVIKKGFITLDTKYRKPKILPFECIQKITFCEQNENIFILHFHEYNYKKLYPTDKIKDLIIVINCRQQLIQFLTSKLQQQLQQNMIRIKFSKQIDIWIKINEKKTLLEKIKDIKNISKFTLLNYNIFEVSIFYDNIFSLKKKTILIIQPIGMLFFQSENYLSIQLENNLLFFIPIVINLKIQFDKNKNINGIQQIKISYQFKKKKKFILQVESFAIAIKLINIIKKIKKIQEKEKEQKIAEYCRNFPSSLLL